MGPGLDRRTLRDAVEDQVYIFNVGPFPRKPDAAIGLTAYLPALPEDKVLKGLAVAGPVIEQGLPELYPSEPPGRVLQVNLPLHLKWVDADGEEFLLADRPAIDKALRIIGGHQGSKPNPYAASPFQQGCFVSTIPEQTVQPKEPEDPGPKAPAQARREYAKALTQYEEDVRISLKWEASVTAAQIRFEKWAMDRGQEYSIAFANGNYRWEANLNAELHMLARILGKTVEDWKFLAGTPLNTKSKPCWACQRPNPPEAVRCQGDKCGEMLVTQEEYEARRPKSR